MTKLAVQVEDCTLPLGQSGSFTLGREQGSTVQVGNELVSDAHLVGIGRAGRWKVRDLGGEGGTFLDGERLLPGDAVELTDGLELILGHSVLGAVLRVVDVDAEAAGPKKSASRAERLVPKASPKQAVVPQVAAADSVPIEEPLVAAEPAPEEADPVVEEAGSEPPLSADSPPLIEPLGSQDNESAEAAPEPKWRRVEPPALAPVMQILPTGKVWTVGRTAGNSVILANPTVSAQHAKLVELSDGNFRVEDLRSTNGTFVDGARVLRQVAEPGAIIGFGSAVLELTSAGLQPLAQPPSTRPDGRNVALSVSGVSYSIELVKAGPGTPAQYKTLLDEVTFAIPQRSLLAVIGPSGAGKSTLMRVITGALKPQEGQVLFNGLDMSVFAKSLAGRVGVVPQEDLVHRQLSARQALEYAAALRFPDDAAPSERTQAVDWAIRELGLVENAETKVRNLSGGQRKRVSTAMELLTKPDLLLLDEPTSGLDPNLDREVMGLLADLAHGTPQSPDGRTVVVITHSTDNLDRADNVLVLAPGGRVAYFGPPQRLQGYFAGLHGDSSWAAIYARISAEPEAAKAEFASGPLAPVPALIAPQHAGSQQGQQVRRRRLIPQTLTLLGRQARLMLADRSLMLFTVALPIVVGLLTLAVQAAAGFTAAAEAKDLGQPRALLVIVIFGAVLMGMVPAVRQLVTERVIFVHEAGAGVRPAAYLASKVLLLGVVCAIQSALLVSMTLLLNTHPDTGTFAPIWVELFLVVLATSWTCAALGLLASSLVHTAEQVMPLMVVLLMLQLVLGGGVLPVIAPGINQASLVAPGRWGYAAGASSLDFNWIITCRAQILAKQKEDEEVNKKSVEATDEANQEAAEQARGNGWPVPTAKEAKLQHTVVNCATVEDQDDLWRHTVGAWLMDLYALGFWFAVYVGGTWYSLRRLLR